MKIISASIDLSKIDKSKIIEGKSGAKYYNLTITCFDQNDKYGNDIAITEPQTKEEREAKTPKIYLGNGRTVYGGGATQQVPVSETKKEGGDNLPF